MSGHKQSNSSPVLGSRIAALRKKAQLTQPELATRAGVSISTVYRAERSDDSIGPRMVARIALALSVQPDAIYCGDVVMLADGSAVDPKADERHEEVVHKLTVLQSSVDEIRPDSVG